MKENLIPSSISHKKLKGYLNTKSKAHKKSSLQVNIENNDLKEVDQLIKSWSSKSHELLDLLKSRNTALVKGRSSNSLIALGAMEAHLNMAIQALKAAEM